MRDVLISGMFRSGTTFLSRVLSTHPSCLLVSDPCIYFFKAYRNFHFEQLGIEIAWDAPTSDGFDDPHHAVLQRIRLADFSEPMPRHYQERVRADIRTWKSAQHPELCQRLDTVHGARFQDFYRSLMALLDDIYGTGSTGLLGTKVSWCEGFLPALGRAFEDMRFVLLVRDLRAVVASQNSQTGAGMGKRPLLFYIRHWRKSVGFTLWLSQLDAALAERVLVVRYEDLVTDLPGTVHRLCQHLSLSPDARMLQPESWPDLRMTGQWKPNSSFGGASGLYTSSCERWRTVLSDVEVAAIEALAGPELQVMGYPVRQPLPEPEAYLAEGCEPPFDELAGWIQGFACTDVTTDPQARRREWRRECRRRLALGDPSRVDPEELARMFVHPGIVQILRAQDR